VRETARVTDSKIELTEEEQAALNDRLQLLSELDSDAEALFTYFQPDQKKAGGAYITVSGCIKRLDDFERTVILTDGTKISVKDILSIQCKALERFSSNECDIFHGGGAL